MSVTKRQPIRSYVRREGRMTAAQSRALIEHVGAYLISPLPAEINAATLFNQSGPMTLEIGFGMGESLLAMARAQPKRLFLGVEVHRPGVGALLIKLAKENLTNVKLCCDDALTVLGLLDNAQLDRVQLFFPDPWHKTRHHKRRLIQKDFLSLLATKLKPEGVLHIATDWMPYADAIEALLQNQVEYVVAPARLAEKLTTERPLTKYESRGKVRGHGIRDLVYCRRDQSAEGSQCG